MFCPNCGTKLEENAGFCPNCGAKQTEETANSMPGIFKAKTVGSSSVNILEIIAAVIMALGTLLPCYSVSFFGMSESVSYIEGDGLFVLIAAIAVAVLCIIKKDKFAWIPALLPLVLLINLCSEISGAGIGGYGIGMYFMWIGAIASIVLPFIPLKFNK